MKKSSRFMTGLFALGAMLVIGLSGPVAACGGGQVDKAEAARSQLSLLDSYLDNPQKLEVIRHSALQRKPGVEVKPLTAEQMEQVRKLRAESAQLVASASEQRSRNGVRSKLATLQFERASEKASEALLVLGAPAIVPVAPLFRCGVQRPAPTNS